MQRAASLRWNTSWKHRLLIIYRNLLWLNILFLIHLLYMSSHHPPQHFNSNSKQQMELESNIEMYKLINLKSCFPLFFQFQLLFFVMWARYGYYIYIYIYIYMKSSFPKRDKRQIKKINEFVMPFSCVLNLFTAPSMFHAKSLYFLV